MRTTISFGAMALPIGQQCPELDAVEAERFDKDNMAIVYLSVRGLISGRDKDLAFRRLSKRVGNALAAASTQEKG